MFSLAMVIDVYTSSLSDIAFSPSNKALNSVRHQLDIGSLVDDNKSLVQPMRRDGMSHSELDKNSIC
jgi:hypothetical protein